MTVYERDPCPTLPEYVDCSGYGDALLPMGENWGTGTQANPNCRISLFRAAAKIARATAGKANIERLALVLNWELAVELALTDEARTWIAHLLVDPQGTGQSSHFGIPKYIYGVEVVVTSFHSDRPFDAILRSRWNIGNRDALSAADPSKAVMVIRNCLG